MARRPLRSIELIIKRAIGVIDARLRAPPSHLLEPRIVHVQSDYQIEIMTAIERTSENGKWLECVCRSFNNGNCNVNSNRKFILCSSHCHTIADDIDDADVQVAKINKCAPTENKIYSNSIWIALWHSLAVRFLYVCTLRQPPAKSSKRFHDDAGSASDSGSPRAASHIYDFYDFIVPIMNALIEHAHINAHVTFATSGEEHDKCGIKHCIRCHSESTRYIKATLLS